MLTAFVSYFENLALLFPCGGLLDTWLPFGEVFLDLLVNPRVQCEADYS